MSSDSRQVHRRPSRRPGLGGVGRVCRVAADVGATRGGFGACRPRRRRSAGARRDPERQEVLPDQGRRPAPNDRQRPGRRRRLPRHPTRRDARSRRGIRLRQDDPRADGAAARAADERAGALRRPGHLQAQPVGAQRRCAAGCRSSSRTRSASLNPRMPVSDLIGEGLLAQADPENGWGKRQMRDKRVGDYLEAVGLRRDYARRYPARILRRPAAAHRHRPRPRPRSRVHRVRRAGVGARRLDPVADPQPARRPARAVQPDVPVRRAQPVGHRVHQRPRRGHVPRQARRARGRRRSSTRGPAIRTRSPSCRPSRTPIPAFARSASCSRATCRRRPTRRPAAASTPAAGCAKRLGNPENCVTTEPLLRDIGTPPGRLPLGGGDQRRDGRRARSDRRTGRQGRTQRPRRPRAAKGPEPAAGRPSIGDRRGSNRLSIIRGAIGPPPDGRDRATVRGGPDVDRGGESI